MKTNDSQPMITPFQEAPLLEPIETTISASFTGKISTAQWENSSPFFSFSEKYTIPLSDEFKKNRQKELSEICTMQFNGVAERLYQEKIAKTYESIRFYDGANGLKYPSVTSIIGMDEDFAMSPDELAQYSARGTIIHKQVETFLKTGIWQEPKNLPEIYPDWLTLSQGNLGLTLEGYDFQQFFKDYPFKVIELEKTVVNHELRYGGRLDIKCLIESTNKGKWEKEPILFDVPTILDIKTGTIDKTKNMKQQTAYARCENDVKQFGIIPLNSTTKQGYSKPIVENDMEKYWTLFKRDRENFKKRYGV